MRKTPREGFHVLIVYKCFNHPGETLTIAQASNYGAVYEGAKPNCSECVKEQKESSMEIVRVYEVR